MSAVRLAVWGITFDFGNTLVRVDRAGFTEVLDRTAAGLLATGSILEPAAFLAAWAAERDRQFRLQVPLLREVDLQERFVHVFARLRGAHVPREDAEPWDEAGAAARAQPEEVTSAAEMYSHAFVATMQPLPDAEPTLREAHARGFRLGVLSNWPYAPTIDRYVEERGWARYLRAVVVSQRVGVIKPHPAIFAAAAACLAASPDRLLHVGDDWAADVVGAHRAGWLAAYLRGHQDDTPLPTSTPDLTVRPDLELDRLSDVLARVELPGRPPGVAQ